MSLHQFFSILRARLGVVALDPAGDAGPGAGLGQSEARPTTRPAPRCWSTFAWTRWAARRCRAWWRRATCRRRSTSSRASVSPSGCVADAAGRPAADAASGAKRRSKEPAPQAVARPAASQAGLEVKPARESNIINISWTGRSPAEAARVANAFAQAYLDTNLELKTTPARKYADWFEEQVKASRDRLETAQQKLSAFQERAGIVSSDERGDYETARLTELSSQLLRAQSGRGAAADRRHVAGRHASPLVNNMRADVAKLESKVQEASATMGAEPSADAAHAGRAGNDARPGWPQESARVGSASAASGEAGRARERELQQAVAAQKGARDRDQQAARRTHRAAARSGHRAEGLRDGERQRGRSRACRA